MPLHTLSIRRRGTTPAKSSAPPATTTHTIKGLFHRKTLDSSSNKSIKKTNSDMGNAPSDMNGNGTPKQKPSSASDRDSIRSRAMPGAEPPTPTPAPDSVPAKEGAQRSPEPDTVQVLGYDTQDVPHVLNSPKAMEEPDLEAGMIPAVTSFEAEEAAYTQQPQATDEAQNPDSDTQAARTPRAELKTEEGLTPLDLGSLSQTAHQPEGSDATAVAISPRVPGVWTPGTYVLLNVRGGSAMDLSGVDNRTVIGFPMHGGPNQQWDFVPSGHGYLIRCVRRSSEGHPLYLTVEGGVKHTAPIVASSYPVAWNIEQTEDGIRIMWPNSNFAFDLEDWGKGTKIQLADNKPKEACQRWHFTRCAPASDAEREKDMSVESRSARAVSPPATTETVTIAEEREFVTTTRTTTTTVITTVTEVTRTPKSLFRQQQPQRRSIAYR